MSVMEKLRNFWTRYGGGFNSLARCEQVEILHGVWTFSLALSCLACIATHIVTIIRLIEFLA